MEKVVSSAGTTFVVVGGVGAAAGTDFVPNPALGAAVSGLSSGTIAGGIAGLGSWYNNSIDVKAGHELFQNPKLDRVTLYEVKALKNYIHTLEHMLNPKKENRRLALIRASSLKLKPD